MVVSSKRPDLFGAFAFVRTADEDVWSAHLPQPSVMNGKTCLR
ncbi:hypothetical protein OU5_P0072 (plasmid) [Pseudomonas mandelii JR-1]|uniref:Uncharacterized protein n=1 Tax=Pseudomonas mandelii JR-1 TaxID=1147786 RepID=A0A024EK75_9PSED|nr:hypothetical protein OU5_P0072 [Pseudomonas mandelii JR-1]